MSRPRRGPGGAHRRRAQRHRHRRHREHPAGEGVDRAVLAESRLAELRAHTGADVVAVTLDTEGAVVGGADGEPRRSHSTPVPASHAVGAGDAYLAAMTLALAADAPLPTAAQLAQLAATITVSDTGTCVCRREDLLAALDQPTSTTATRLLVGADELDAIVAEHREAGRSVVFTNGCFDVLHRGHVRYLEQARALGDLLVVAVNSDGSVRRLKGAGPAGQPGRGPGRPARRARLRGPRGGLRGGLTRRADRGGPPGRVRQGRRLPAGAGAGGAAGAPAGRPGAHPRVRAGPVHLRDHRADPVAQPGPVDAHLDDRRAGPVAAHPHPGVVNRPLDLGTPAEFRADRLLDVLIPTRNRPAELAVTLAGLAAQDGRARLRGGGQRPVRRRSGVRASRPRPPWSGRCATGVTRCC